MILDLHCHSDASEDSRAPLETYLKWLQRKRDLLPIDGIVLTEHRQWDPTLDYRALEDAYGILILRGAEVETDYGHVLVYGVNDDITRRFDFANVRLPAQEVISEVARLGGVAAPCHPGPPDDRPLRALRDEAAARGRRRGRGAERRQPQGRERARAGAHRPLRLRRLRRQRRPPGEPDRHLRHRVRRTTSARSTIWSRRCSAAAIGRWTFASRCARRGGGGMSARPIDRSMVGQEFDHTVFPPVTEEQILAYARAYGETNPLYTDATAATRGPHGGLIAPPTFVVSACAASTSCPSELPKELGRDGFDAGKDVELGVPVRPGDVLTDVEHRARHLREDRPLRQHDLSRLPHDGDEPAAARRSRSSIRR